MDDQQRGLLNLPPLFKPHPIQHDTAQARPAPSPPVFSNLLVANKTQKPPVPPAIANPEDLPAAQEFLATTSDSETSQSISVMPAFRGFSPEVSTRHLVSPSAYFFFSFYALYSVFNYVWLGCDHRNFATMHISKDTSSRHHPSRCLSSLKYLLPI